MLARSGELKDEERVLYVQSGIEAILNSLLIIQATKPVQPKEV